MLADLIAELPDGTVVTDPDIVASYRQDRAADPNAGTAMAVVRPRRTEEVQTVMRWATAHRVPVVPRGAGTGLSGGATALDGGIVLSTERMRDIAVDPVTRTAVDAARAVQRRGEEGRRRVRAVVPARPVVVRDLQHRRQHRHQRRRAVLREVRRDDRLRARHAGGAGRRHRGAPRRPAPERRCGTEPDEAVRRQRGHPRHRHRGDAEAAARAAPRLHRGGVVRLGGGRRGRGRRRSPARSGRRCWSSWTPSPSTPSRTS